MKKLYQQKDKLWLSVWVGGIGLLWIWNQLFLNKPALYKIEIGFLNTLVISILVIIISFLLSWSTGVGLYFLENASNSAPYWAAAFILNIVRSIPQIIGILIGYIFITLMIQSGALQNKAAMILLIAITISLFVFLEIVDLIRERINYFKQLDFYNAMLVCGIPESRIINREILWKNSLTHITHKLISIFGVTIFLLCSIDFIISVGLSTTVSLVNLPLTLGNVLADYNSKQDILAISNIFTNPFYFKHLFFKHLQGVTVAFLIVFSLLCIYKISNGFTKRYEL